ncbi:Glycine/D-amino acid oxidase [Arboricoccus pini]|uniref:Glycine/D-amino acid oxidase n=1 Tax=Arboricoccus pini TaxID=1963835 RepID=A0A212RVX8_9PROT|nr:FAD-binding oxidoreductase [Arboricoccus pini]SNB76741.1 Glycine/D-amino acid oxidase [Arboricoccus pini]
MGPQVDIVENSDKLPATSDVVVIGGGIVGTSTTLALARRGISVTLCEKGHIAGEQSSRNWGWVRKMGRDRREVPLVISALRLWEGMNELVGGETGFRRTGILYACETDEALAVRETWADEVARPYQLDSRLISGKELEELTPGMTRKLKGALYTKSDGRAEPQKAAPAIARGARAMGATVLQQCAVRGVETTGGRVSGVVTEKGRIACNAVVLAGGAWSRLFSGSLGITLPQLKVLSSVLRTAPLDGGPETAMWTSRYAYRKRLDGGYNIADGNSNIHPLVPDTFAFFAKFLPALKHEWGAIQLRLDDRFMTELRMPKKWDLDKATPFEQTRTLDPTPIKKLPDTALGRLAEDFPVFKGAKVEQHWAGLIDVTPDAVPVISPVDSLPGFFIGTGFSGHGFGIGPGAGALLADLVTGATPLVDPSDFRLSRFFDGSKIWLDAGV